MGGKTKLNTSRCDKCDLEVVEPLSSLSCIRHRSEKPFILISHSPIAPSPHFSVEKKKKKLKFSAQFPSESKITKQLKLCFVEDHRMNFFSTEAEKAIPRG
jgi:hypothetical protein